MSSTLDSETALLATAVSGTDSGVELVKGTEVTPASLDGAIWDEETGTGAVLAVLISLVAVWLTGQTVVYKEISSVVT